MKILVVTSVPWRDDNSLGNSFSNIFSGIDAEFANIYLQSGMPQNNIVDSYFQITEKSLIVNMKNKKKSTGKVINQRKSAEVLSSKESANYNILRSKRWQVLFWGRELIWKLGDWKSDELNAFIENFNPDIIFAPLQTGMYINDIIVYAKLLTNKPLITYAWDDIYTLKQFSLSPLYWIDRILQRLKIKETVSLSEFVYVISELQKKEYEICFGKECKILWKGYEFSNSSLHNFTNEPLKMVFTGNVYHGRWKTIKLIGKALKKINKDKTMAQMYVYTLSPITSKIRKALYMPGNIFLMGGVDANEVSKLQINADILVHTEAFSLKDMLVARLSFSTKLVDYFFNGKCIFAVGKQESASINYLINNDAAFVATDKKNIYKKLNQLVNNKSIISEYAFKSWSCGNTNHQINNIQAELFVDLNSLMKD